MASILPPPTTGDGATHHVAGEDQLSQIRRLAVAWLLALDALGPGTRSASADIVYLYDDLGRLVRVILEDGESASYHYDTAGNLLEITRESNLPQTTTISAISRDSGGRGATVPVTLHGTNLVGASVACASESLAVENLRTSFDRITLELVVSGTAPLGPTTCEVRGLAAQAFVFTIVTPPQGTLASSQSLSIATAAPPSAVDRNLPTSLSIAWGVAARWFPHAPAVAVAREPLITAVTPSSGAAGTPSLEVTLSGVGLAETTAVEFLLGEAPDGSITLLRLTANSAGTAAVAEIAIAGGASPGPRLVRVITPQSVTTAASTGANLFTVE